MPAHAVLSWPKFFLLCRVVLALLLLVYSVELTMVLRANEWHSQLFRLISRAWQQFVTNDVGSTSRGFTSEVLSGFLVIACGALFIAAVHGIKAMKDHVWETGAMTLVGLATVLLLVYGTQFLWELVEVGYRDHQSLVTALSNTHTTDQQSSDTTRATIKQLQSELDSRKHNIFVGDPAFGNITHLLQTFQGYRIRQNNKPCVMYITAPPDSMNIASEVAQLSNSVSGCFTFGPSGEGNPDLDEMTKDGMVPNVILVHTERENHSGITLQENLSSQIQARISYAPPKIPRNQLYAGREFDGSESFIWLQFGTGVKWNSERFK